MNRRILNVVMFAAVIAVFASCTALSHSMKEPNVRVNLNKSDFTLSDQVTAEAKTRRIIGIDWAKPFSNKTGVIDNNSAASISLASIPVIGNAVSDRTANYALYELMSANPGYDVVFYPQYETKVSKPILGIGFLLKTTTVKATARLGKLNK